MRKYLLILLIIFACEEANLPTNTFSRYPSVVITYPAYSIDFSNLDSTTTIKVDAIDDIGVANVKFLINGNEVYTDTTAPYEYEWDICSFGYSTTCSVLAKAEDSDGNVSQSDLETQYGVNMIVIVHAGDY